MGTRDKQTTAEVVERMDARKLIPSKENLILYRDRKRSDKDYARLLKSVRVKCVEAPLLISEDLYIISGHQRRKAAIQAKKFMVPVIIKAVRRTDYSDDQWLALLREHNVGREKTFDELVREQLVDIDPDEAVAQVLGDHIERSTPRVLTIDISDKEMHRCKISEEKRAIVDAVLEVLRGLNDYLPVSVRAVHYRLLDRHVYRNTKQKLLHVNDWDSYSRLSDLLTRLRLTGVVPWDSICDETRPVTEWQCWRNAADFLADQAAGFGKGYARDLMQSQVTHFEIVTEKLAVKNFVEPVAWKYRIPSVIMRGNSGIDARYQILQRFGKSGKDGLFIFCLGDCDPDGDSIVETTLTSLRDDFGVACVEGTRIAMTHQQADSLHLPRKLKAKESSPNYKAFVHRHGRTDAYELDAVEPAVLQTWLDTAIRGVIDVEAYNHEVGEQKAEAASILARRKAVLKMMRTT
jgi:hypothetical protein